MKEKVKPRSRAEINKPLSSARIIGRIKRLNLSREKAVARGNAEKVKSIDESLDRYRAEAKILRDQLSNV